jgi:hypothetical protein
MQFFNSLLEHSACLTLRVSVRHTSTDFPENSIQGIFSCEAKIDMQFFNASHLRNQRAIQTKRSRQVCRRVGVLIP